MKPAENRQVSAITMDTVRYGWREGPRHPHGPTWRVVYTIGSLKIHSHSEKTRVDALLGYLPGALKCLMRFFQLKNRACGKSFGNLPPSKLSRCTARFALEEFAEVSGFLKTKLLRNDADGEVCMYQQTLRFKIDAFGDESFCTHPD